MGVAVRRPNYIFKAVPVIIPVVIANISIKGHVTWIIEILHGFIMKNFFSSFKGLDKYSQNIFKKISKNFEIPEIPKSKLSKFLNVADP